MTVWITMLKIFLLFNIIQHIKSYNINLYDVKLQALGPSNIQVSFRIKKEIQHLTGEFSVSHYTCRGICGTLKYGHEFPFKHERDQGKTFSITARLSPCKSYTGIKIRAEARNNVFNEVTTMWTPVWNPKICPHLKTTISIITTPTTMTIESTPSSTNSTLPPDSQSGSAAVIGIVAGVLISLVLIVLAILLFKRRRNREDKKGEEMPADLNPVYGIYDDGPDYNVVTDENDYYDS